ncbi:MAG: hypothetical protein KDI11_07190 [Alphaproteobacteria bacterium]|nr:hypothetical protein [Alphaproteobacteria bacterium]
MIYVIGIVGFIGGFIFGQMVLYFLLRHKTNQELLEDRMLKIKYGLIGWGCAALGAYSFVEIYKVYFPSVALS